MQCLPFWLSTAGGILGAGRAICFEFMTTCVIWVSSSMTAWDWDVWQFRTIAKVSADPRILLMGPNRLRQKQNNKIWCKSVIRVTTAQKYQQRKGHMISHQTHFNLRLHHWYYLQPFQSLHSFHFKELYVIISLHNHFSNACSSHFYDLEFQCEAPR